MSKFKQDWETNEEDGSGSSGFNYDDLETVSTDNHVVE